MLAPESSPSFLPLRLMLLRTPSFFLKSVLGFHIEFRWCKQPAYRQLPLVVHCYFIAGDQMKRKGGNLNPFTLRFNLVLGNLQFQPQFCGWCSSIFPFKIGMFHFHRCSGGSCPVQVTWRSLWHHLPPAKKNHHQMLRMNFSSIHSKTLSELGLSLFIITFHE